MYPLSILLFAFTVDIPNWLFATNTLVGLLIGLIVGLILGRARR